MDPVLSALLLSWEWRVDVILILGLAGLIFSRGWWHLRQHKGKRLAVNWRLGAYLGGLVFLGLALMSPIDVLGGQLFYMHMIQHLLLVMIVPPLLLITNPLPFFLWGLPFGLKGRRQVGRFLNRKSDFRRNLRLLTPRGLIWMIFFATFLIWHDPNIYNAALRNNLIHDLEHLTFFVTAMLFWWHVTGAGPAIHRRFSYAARLVYLLVALPINMLVGIIITFADQPIYTYYTTVPRLWGMSVIEDQMLGGVIMWIPGSMMYLLAAVILVIRMLQAEESRPPLPNTELAQAKL